MTPEAPGKIRILMTAQGQYRTMPDTRLKNLRICIKGAGDLATGVAVRLHASGFTRILMLETRTPLSVRRGVSFSEAVCLQEKIVEGVPARRVDRPDQVDAAWAAGWIPVMVDPAWQILKTAYFDVMVDAIMAKRNLGSQLSDASLVIGLGPGFTAGLDAHRVVETHRGHHLGRVLRTGRAIPNTGIPGAIAGFGIERVLRAPMPGIFKTALDIGDRVNAGQIVGRVGDAPVTAGIDGILRGLLRSGTAVGRGTKLGDIDPRKEVSNCRVVSDKARAIGGGVLEAILEAFLARHMPRD